MVSSTAFAYACSRISVSRTDERAIRIAAASLLNHRFVRGGGHTLALSRRSQSTLEANEASIVPQQHFIKTRLAAGEWDPTETNPLYRPKFKSSARIIAADDFAARPTVGFSGEFNTLTDAMVTLSWLDQTEHAQIYKLYCDMMLSAESSQTNASSTSHEYVMRVIAQQYNLTAERVAAVVQLQHNEEQMKIQKPEQKLLTETANRMDSLIRQEIKDAYESFKLKPPSDSFTEDPVGVNELQDRKQWTIAEDVLDVDGLAQAATVRLEQKARRIIDGHVYIEDVYDEDIPVPMDHDCRQLLQQRERVQRDLMAQEARVVQQRTLHHAVEPQWRTAGATGANEATRPRWKFIAQTVNTRLLKKQKQKHRSYINNSAENTIVEQDGTLRNGTMAELKTVAWKLQRHEQEHMYAGAKRGWLDRVHNRKGTTQPWGKAPPVVAATAPVDATTDTPVVSSETSEASDEIELAAVEKNEENVEPEIKEESAESATLASVDGATNGSDDKPKQKDSE